MELMKEELAPMIRFWNYNEEPNNFFDDIEGQSDETFTQCNERVMASREADAGKSFYFDH